MAETDPTWMSAADLRREVVWLREGIGAIAARGCLCDGHLFNPPHGGPCCGVAGGQCVTCDARSLLDDESEAPT